MSSRPSTERGFTLLECEVALLVLMLLVFGVMRLTSAHEQLVDDMEDVLAESGSTWYVDAPDELEERALGLPARLVSTPPASGNWVDNTDELTALERAALHAAGQVFVLEVDEAGGDLDPMSASATVTLDALP